MVEKICRLARVDGVVEWKEGSEVGGCWPDGSVLLLFWEKRCVLLVICPTLQGSPFRNCEIPRMLSLTQLHLRLSGLTMVHSRNKETKWVGALQVYTAQVGLPGALGALWFCVTDCLCISCFPERNETFVLQCLLSKVSSPSSQALSAGAGILKWFKDSGKQVVSELRITLVFLN